MEAQAAYARMQFARKHFRRRRPTTAGRWRCATGCGSALYSAAAATASAAEREAARAALATVLQRQPPFARRSAAAGPQATIVSAPGSTRSSTRVRSPM